MFTQVEHEEDKMLSETVDMSDVLQMAHDCLTDVFDELLSIKYLIEGI